MRDLSLLIAVGCASFSLASVVHAQRLKPPDRLNKLEARAEADSNDAHRHFDLALGYWSEARYDDAEASIRLAIGIEPHFAEAHLALAYLPYARQPELWEVTWTRRAPEIWREALAEADRSYRKAFVLNPLVDLKIIGAVIPPKSAEAEPKEPLLYEMLVQVLDDVLEERYDRAHRKLQRLITDLEFDRDPNQAPEWLLWYRALTGARLEKHEDAIRDLETLLARSRKDERGGDLMHVPLKTNEYRYVLGALKQGAGLLDEALELYREALEHDLTLYMAHVQIARIHESRENWLEAAEACRNALAIKPEDPSLLYDLGVMLGRANRFGEAEESLLRAQMLNPRDARIQYVLGLVRISRGNPDGAREALERFVSIAPRRFERMIEDAERRLASLR